MQAGVHGRRGDLRLCHLHLFTNLYTLSLCEKSFETVPLISPFLPCRMVCMAGAVTSAFAIFISSKKLLKLSLYDPLFYTAGWVVCLAGPVISAFAIFISLQIFIHYPFATKSFKTVPLKSLFCHAGWCAWQAR
jgi:hypothetical protein